MMRLYFSSIALSILWTIAALAQIVAPARIQWQKRYDNQGSADRSPSLRRTLDGGFLLGGQTFLGDASNRAQWDYWVLRLDQNGNRLWQTNFGGPDREYLWALQETSDGGVILAGEHNVPSAGRTDSWVLRLDAHGNKLWDKFLGSNCWTEAHAVLQTSDGGFLVAGTYCSAQYWVVRLDAQGEKLWDGTYMGGVLTDLKQLPNQGFILAGYSSAGIGGDKTSTNYGGNDLWLVRIDAEGNKLWDQSYGGSRDDGVNARVLVTADNGFLVGANTMSGISGNKTSPFGGGNFYGDYWVLRLDSEGNKLWEQDFGGTGDDVFGDVVQSLDGGFVVAGWMSSGTNGRVWLVRLDPTGGRIWDETYNGADYLAWPRLQGTADGGIMMATSVHGDPAEPATTDLMLLKLSPDALTAPQLRFPLAFHFGSEFRFQLSGISNRTYVTEFSSNLLTWLPLATNLMSSSPVDIVDLEISSPQRFYRARMVE